MVEIHCCDHDRGYCDLYYGTRYCNVKRTDIEPECGPPSHDTVPTFFLCPTLPPKCEDCIVGQACDDSGPLRSPIMYFLYKESQNVSPPCSVEPFNFCPICGHRISNSRIKDNE